MASALGCMGVSRRGKPLSCFKSDLKPPSPCLKEDQESPGGFGDGFKCLSCKHEALSLLLGATFMYECES